MGVRVKRKAVLDSHKVKEGGGLVLSFTADSDVLEAPMEITGARVIWNGEYLTPDKYKLEINLLGSNQIGIGTYETFNHPEVAPDSYVNDAEAESPLLTHDEDIIYTVYMDGIPVDTSRLASHLDNQTPNSGLQVDPNTRTISFDPATDERIGSHELRHWLNNQADVESAYLSEDTQGSAFDFRVPEHGIYTLSGRITYSKEEPSKEVEKKHYSSYADLVISSERRIFDTGYLIFNML